MNNLKLKVFYNPSKLILLILLLSLMSCVNADRMYEVIEQDGVESVEITGYAWTGCGEDDSIKQKFIGIKNNKPVSGVICGGILKAYTVRYF